MVISLNDVDIAMPRMDLGELTEPSKLSAWYRPLFHFAYTFAHILPNATLAFAVLVINTHCSGETASRVDGCIKQISICPLCLVWVRDPRWQHVSYAYELVFLAFSLIFVICIEYIIQHIYVHLSFSFQLPLVE